MKTKNSTQKRVAETSILAHREEQQKGTYQTQENQVLNLLRDRTLNSRQIHEAMCRIKYLDLSSTRRAISSLLDQNLIRIAKIDRCPITKRKVRYYQTTKDAEQLLFDF